MEAQTESLVDVEPSHEMEPTAHGTTSQPPAVPENGTAGEVCSGDDAEEVAHAGDQDAKSNEGDTSVEIVDPRPRIHLPGDGRMISDVAAELGQLLAAKGLFSFQGCAADYDEENKILNPMKPARFRSWVEKFVIPIKSKEDGDVEHSMSSGDASAVLFSDHFLENLSEVERINAVRLPVMRNDGSVELLPEGYDSGNKILTTRDSVDYATDMPITEAKLVLDELMSEFPFADRARSKAITIASMMTLFGLDLIPPKTNQPVFLYRANQPGLGKGLLAQTAMIPVLGYAPTGVRPKDEDEMRKFLFAIAREGRPVAFLDNVTGKIASASLESFITASTVTGRVLGSSKSLNCRKKSVVFITGNNCTLNGDMARRTLISDLYLDGDPANRIIRNHLDENRLLEMRSRILAALYALVREWAEAGKPAPAKINPNFVVWSQTVGGIVEHAGFGSVTEMPAIVATIDPMEADMFTLTDRLLDERGTDAVTFSEVAAIAATHKLFTTMLQDGGGQARAKNTALGRFLASHDQQTFSNGLRFVVTGKAHARRYAVQQLGVQAATA